MSDLADLAARAARHGFTLVRWHDPAHHPFNLESVVFVLRGPGRREVRVGSAANVERLLAALEAREAA